MSRDEFMRELEYLLQDIPEEDKADALFYYRDYLDEAGADAEQAIREFGSPERIAAIIRSDIAGHLEAGGEFTERGYEDERFRDPNYQVMKRYDLPEEGAEQKKEQRSKAEKRHQKEEHMALKVVLGIILILVGFPIAIGLGGGAIGVLGGLLGILVACVVTIGIVTVVFFVTAAIVGVVGIMMLAVEPLSGVLAIGIGCLLMGFAVLMLLVSVQFYGRFLPWLFTGTVELISRMVRRKGR